MSDEHNEAFENAEEFRLIHDPTKTRVNVPEKELVPPHTLETQVEQMLHERAARAETELLNGFHAVQKFPKSVTFFGSARLPEDDPHYIHAREIAGRICKLGYAVVTGGGPGIMEAGNRGACETCNASVGFNIELPMEQNINPYVTHGVNFHYFYTRKVTMFFSAEVYVFFAGGFGTLDEFFELVTLVQTNKIPRVPIVLVGTDFWNPVQELLKTHLLEKFGTISPEDLDLYTITDDTEAVLEIVKNAPLRNEY